MDIIAPSPQPSTTSTTSMKVCVTGCTGYLASHIIVSLLHRGYTVHGTMRNVSQSSRIQHIMDSPGAIERFKVFAADLSVENSFDEAVKGCQAVIHVANVVALSAKDVINDIILPSVNGLKAVLSAVEKEPSVHSFILTSSYAAIEVGIPPNPRGPLTEADSNTAASPEWKVCHLPPPSHHFLLTSWCLVQPYSFSKVETERHAMEWIEKQKRAGRLVKYASIHPPMIIGPQLNGDSLQSSSEVFEVMLNGTYPLLPPLWFPMVDVRDVAKAHILALEHPAANGRYLVCNGHQWLMDLANWIRQVYPTFPVPKYSMPVWAFKVVGLFDKRIDKGVLKENTQEVIDPLCFFRFFAHESRFRGFTSTRPKSSRTSGLCTTTTLRLRPWTTALRLCNTSCAGPTGSPRKPIKLFALRRKTACASPGTCARCAWTRWRVCPA